VRATASERIDFDRIVAPTLVKLMELWEEWRAGKRMPRPDEVHLPRLKDMASRLSIWDCTEKDPGRYRLLVCGSRIMLAGCRDLTGMRLSELPISDDYRALLMHDYSQVLWTGKPMASRVVLALYGQAHPYQRVIVPVGRWRTTHLVVCSEVPRELRIPMTAEMLEQMKQRKLAEQHTFSQPSLWALRSA
jgi:hypothetical protein